MIYCDFFKNSVKINIKEKKKNCCHISLKPLREVMCPVSGVQGVRSDGFVVQGAKRILSKVEEGKRDFFPIGFLSSLAYICETRSAHPGWVHAMHYVWLIVSTKSGCEKTLFGCLHEDISHEIKKIIITMIFILRTYIL